MAYTRAILGQGMGQLEPRGRVKRWASSLLLLTACAGSPPSPVIVRVPHGCNPYAHAVSADMPAASEEHFTAAGVWGIGEGVIVRQAQWGEDDRDEGWQISEYDPTGLVCRYPHLSLRHGFVLRAYQRTFGGDLLGAGSVYALPAGEELPKPVPDAEKLVRPPLALRDAMDAIAGDGSARSYLEASLLKDDIETFNDWLMCGTGLPDERLADHRCWDDCNWNDVEPSDRRVLVSKQRERITVTFYTCWELDAERRVYRTVDEYRGQGYVSTTRRDMVAECSEREDAESSDAPGAVHR